jgi:(2R)-sulfolactate sulfo-lyase subunit alpha
MATPSDSPSAGGPDFLAHRDGDLVAVAVRDISPGPARGAILASDSDLAADVRDDVPLGHKFALADIAAGAPIIEYGVQVGVAVEAIPAGAYVHTHNMRSARWQNSVAN